MGDSDVFVPEAIAKSRATSAVSRRVNPNATSIASNKKQKRNKKNTYVQSCCRIIKR